jgi:hypothetical protein
MSARRTVPMVALLLAISAAWVAATPRAAPAGPTRVVTEDGATAAAATAPPTDTTALLADFDGDHRSDLLWYGPGAKADHLWLGRPDRNFVGVPVTVNGSYLPLLGDFNGNGRADVFWYAPGGAGDSVFFGQAGGGFAGRSFTVNGTYQPFVGDFNGDGRADVFWYAPGSGGDVVWYGQAGGGFGARAVTVNGSYQPLLGDFNGDHRGDVFWYGAGAVHDVVWYGRSAGGFSARAATVNGTYQPLLGDFNGDGSRDIFWYGPGAANDVVWYGHTDAHFSARAIAVNGTYQPFTGDFDGDHRRDVFWYGPGAGHDVVWYGRSDARFSAAAATVNGTYQPLPADFGGDFRGDVLWWAPGAANDVLWFGHADRRFTSRSTTVDLDYARALAIRPETLASQYNPYGFVAHAMGAIDGHVYTNSLEAFQRNYGRGFRVFECDQVRLADGTVLVAHDGLEANYGLSKPFQESTWADIVAAGQKYLGKYTILRSQNILHLLIDHPDIFVIPDPKYARPEIFRTYVRQATALGRLDVLQRLLPHVADQTELNALRVYFPLQNYVLALYHTQAQNRYDDPVAVDFVRRNRTPAVMMWHRDRDFSISLAANGRQSRRFRQAFADGLRAAGAVVYVHSLDDPVEIQHFWDLGIGVYSNDPFPPLGTTTPALDTPTFGSRTEKASPPA